MGRFIRNVNPDRRLQFDIIASLISRYPARSALGRRHDDGSQAVFLFSGSKPSIP